MVDAAASEHSAPWGTYGLRLGDLVGFNVGIADG